MGKGFVQYFDYSGSFHGFRSSVEAFFVFEFIPKARRLNEV